MEGDVAFPVCRDTVHSDHKQMQDCMFGNNLHVAEACNCNCMFSTILHVWAEACMCNCMFGTNLHVAEACMCNCMFGTNLHVAEACMCNCIICMLQRLMFGTNLSACCIIVEACMCYCMFGIETCICICYIMLSYLISRLPQASWYVETNLPSQPVYFVNEQSLLVMALNLSQDEFVGKVSLSEGGRG